MSNGPRNNHNMGISPSVLARQLESLNQVSDLPNTPPPRNMNFAPNPLIKQMESAKDALRQVSVTKHTPPIKAAQQKDFEHKGATAVKLSKAPEHQQRYMVSPHTDVENFYDNALGMGAWAIENKRPTVRPVFKDEAQRSAFHKHVKQDISTYYSSGGLDADEKREKQAAEQLRDWSAKGSAMMNFTGTTKQNKGQHPVVYVQGHGQAGDKSIESETGQRVNANQVAKMLNKMDLPHASEVRANSCYSGTQNELDNKSATVLEKDMKRGILDVKQGGDWNKTFAGSLQSALHSDQNKRNGKQRFNRVVGYMGPTYQQAQDDVKQTKFGLMGKDAKKTMAVEIGKPSPDENKYKRSQMSRVHNVFRTSSTK